MTEKHLGDEVAAVADGQLGDAARDRALTHMASCARCRGEVEAHRAVRSRLAALDVPALPVEVTARLLALAPVGHRLPLAPHRVSFGGARAKQPVERPAAAAFAGVASPRHPAPARAGRPRAGRRRIVAAGMLAAAALGGGATLGVRSGGLSGGSGPVVTPGDVELTRYTEMSRSVVMDDPGPVLAAASHH